VGEENSPLRNTARKAEENNGSKTLNGGKEKRELGGLGFRSSNSYLHSPFFWALLSAPHSPHSHNRSVFL